MSYTRTDRHWRIRTHLDVAYDVQLVPHLFRRVDGRELLSCGRADLVPERLLAVGDSGFRDRYFSSTNRWLDSLGIPYHLLELHAGEASKTLDQVQVVLRAARAADLGRRDLILGIGPGTLADIVGLAASLLRKGTPYAIVATTLVCIIDAGLAGKRAVNLDDIKNLVGAYYPPRVMLADPEHLSTLDARRRADGLSEALKVGAMIDPLLVDVIEQHGPTLLRSSFDTPAGTELLDRAIDGILSHLANDLYERVLRRWPDYGHNFGPKLEIASRGQRLHGETVSIDGAVSDALANLIGALPTDDFHRLLRVRRSLGLPVWHPLLDDETFLASALHGVVKTRAGWQHWPIVDRQIGRYTTLEKVTVRDLQAAAAAVRPFAELA